MTTKTPQWGWCTTHQTPARLYADGSGGCWHEDIVESSEHGGYWDEATDTYIYVNSWFQPMLLVPADAPRITVYESEDGDGSNNWAGPMTAPAGVYVWTGGVTEGEQL